MRTCHPRPVKSCRLPAGRDRQPGAPVGGDLDAVAHRGAGPRDAVTGQLTQPAQVDRDLGRGGGERAACGQVGGDHLGVAAVVVEAIRLRQRAAGDLGGQVAGPVGVHGRARPHSHSRRPRPCRPRRCRRATCGHRSGRWRAACRCRRRCRGAAPAVPGQDQVGVVAGPVVQRLDRGAPAAGGGTVLLPQGAAGRVDEEDRVLAVRAAVNPRAGRTLVVTERGAKNKM